MSLTVAFCKQNLCLSGWWAQLCADQPMIPLVPCMQSIITNLLCVRFRNIDTITCHAHANRREKKTHQINDFQMHALKQKRGINRYVKYIRGCISMKRLKISLSTFKFWILILIFFFFVHLISCREHILSSLFFHWSHTHNIFDLVIEANQKCHFRIDSILWPSWYIMQAYSSSICTFLSIWTFTVCHSVVEKSCSKTLGNGKRAQNINSIMSHDEKSLIMFRTDDKTWLTIYYYQAETWAALFRFESAWSVQCQFSIWCRLNWKLKQRNTNNNQNPRFIFQNRTLSAGAETNKMKKKNSFELYWLPHIGSRIVYNFVRKTSNFLEKFLFFNCRYVKKFAVSNSFHVPCSVQFHFRFSQTNMFPSRSKWYSFLVVLNNLVQIDSLN